MRYVRLAPPTVAFCIVRPRIPVAVTLQLTAPDDDPPEPPVFDPELPPQCAVAVIAEAIQTTAEARDLMGERRVASVLRPAHDHTTRVHMKVNLTCAFAAA
jgi:hypothetical protein